MSLNQHCTAEALAQSFRSHPVAKLATASVLVVAAGMGVPVFATGPTDEGFSTAEIDKSIVLVDVEYTGVITVLFPDGTVTEDPASAVIQCTGWFASDDGHVATAGHCLEESDEIEEYMLDNLLAENGIPREDFDARGVTWYPEVENTRAEVSQPSGIEGAPLSGDEPIVAEIVEFQGFDDGDNALLKINKLKNTPALPVAEDQPEVREEVTAVGFPGEVQAISDTTRQASSYKTGRVSSHTTSANGAPMIQIDASLSLGMSGGPVLNEEGAVIGMSSFKSTDNVASSDFVTDTGKMRTFLESQGVDLESVAVAPVPSTAPAPELVSDNTGLSNRTLLIAGVAMAGAVLVGGIGTLVFQGVQQRKRNASLQQQANH